MKEHEMNTPGDFQILPGGAGRLLVHAGFPSRFVEPRNVSVWLPPGYGEDEDSRYPVIYAHDGQNLFNPATAFAGVDWGLDKTLAGLFSEGVRPAMVVGIWNTPARYREYDPQRVFEEWLSPEEQAAYAGEFGRPIAGLYLRFMVEELKPFIDAHFYTRPGRESAFLLGSSMGGVISAYALCEYPGVFGAAACLSTHWPACRGKMVDYLERHLPDPGAHRLYFDYGTETADAPYEPYQRRVDDILRGRGYTFGRNWLTRKFPGEEHSERAWRRRVDIPLRFLLADLKT